MDLIDLFIIIIFTLRIIIHSVFLYMHIFCFLTSKLLHDYIIIIIIIVYFYIFVLTL
jgi:hypothetical protein